MTSVVGIFSNSGKCVDLASDFNIFQVVTENDEIVWDVDWSGVELTQEIPVTPPPLRVSPPPIPAVVPSSVPPVRISQPPASFSPPPPLPSPPTPAPQVEIRPEDFASDSSVRMVRGQRTDLQQLGLRGKPFEIGLRISGGIQPDIAALALGSDEKLVDERYAIFFNQPLSPCGAIRIARQGAAGCSILFDLAVLPPEISRVVVAAAVDGGIGFREAGSYAVEIADTGRLAASHSADAAELNGKNGIILAEIYLRQGSWRVFMRSEGFTGGLDWLFRQYGVVPT